MFGPWARIDSLFEAPSWSASRRVRSRKTFTEDRTRIRALFQHGRDPQIGDKPLGTIEVLEEDSVGAHYEVALLDTAYVREVIPGLQAGLYGASFRFEATAEEFNQRPERSEHNPDGIAERTVTEAKVHELSPGDVPRLPRRHGRRSLADRLVPHGRDRGPTDDLDAGTARGAPSAWVGRSRVPFRIVDREGPWTS